MKIDKDNFYVSNFRDKSVVLHCGEEGMESDLVFASGRMYNDPQLIEQRELLEFIVAAVEAYKP